MAECPLAELALDVTRHNMRILIRLFDIILVLFMVELYCSNSMSSESVCSKESAYNKS